MKKKSLCLAAAAMLIGGLSVASVSAQTIVDDFSGGVTAANHPDTPAYGTWYDITNNTWGTPSDGGGYLKIDDGGFTNGVYAIYAAPAPADGYYYLEATLAVDESAGDTAAIGAYQLGVAAGANAVHRPSGGYLPALSLYGEMTGLTDGDDTANPPEVVKTGIFYLSTTDDLLVGFATDVTSGNFDQNSATWGGSFVTADDITLQPATSASTVVVDAAGTANGTTVFNTIQDAIASFSSTGANAAAPPPFTINVIAASGPYVEALDLDDASVGAGDIQGDIVIQSSQPGELVDTRLNPASGDDGVWIYQDTHNVTFTEFIFSPEQGSLVNDDLVKIDKNNNSPANLITFNSCIFTDVADAGGPLISDMANYATDPGTFTGQLAGTDTLMKVWGDNAEYMHIVVNDSLFYGVQARGLQFGTIATAGGTYQVDLNNTIFSYTGETGTRAPLDSQGNGAQPKVLNIDGCQFLNSRYHAIYAAFQDTNAHEINVTNTIFDGDTRALSLDDNTVATIDGVIINVTDSNPAIVYGGWTDVNWDNLTVNAQGGEAILTVDGGAANTVTIRDAIFSGAGTAFATIASTTFPSIDIDYSAIVQDGTDAVTAIGTPAGLTVGSNIVIADPVFAGTDPAAADYFDVQNSVYAGAGTGASDLGGGADYVGGVNPANPGATTTIYFPSLDPNQSATRPITFTNATGNASYSITDAVLTNSKIADAGDFQVLTTLPVVVPGGGSVDIDVEYTAGPTGGFSPAVITISGPSFTEVFNLLGESTSEAQWMLLDD